MRVTDIDLKKTDTNRCHHERITYYQNHPSLIVAFKFSDLDKHACKTRNPIKNITISKFVNGDLINLTSSAEWSTELHRWIVSPGPNDTNEPDHWSCLNSLATLPLQHCHICTYRVDNICKTILHDAGQWNQDATSKFIWVKQYLVHYGLTINRCLHTFRDKCAANFNANGVITQRMRLRPQRLKILKNIFKASWWCMHSGRYRA
jgi:hypothetical protein